jgi:hypothetical protein
MTFKKKYVKVPEWTKYYVENGVPYEMFKDEEGLYIKIEVEEEPVVEEKLVKEEPKKKPTKK